MNFKLLIFLILLTFITAQDNVIQAYKIGQTIKSQVKDKGINNTYLPINITDIKPNSYLFFMVNINSPESLEKVSLKMVDTKTHHQLIECSDMSIVTCYLSSQHFRQNTLVMAIVECQDFCQFNFVSYWNQPIIIQKEQPIKINFQTQSRAKVLQFNFQNITLNQLRIVMIPDSQNQQYSQEKIVASADGTMPTANKFEFESVSLWSGGQGIFIKRQQMKKKKIIMLVIGSYQMDYTFTCSVIDNTFHQIQFDNLYHDLIGPNDTKLYRLPFKDLPVDIYYSLKLSIYTGKLLLGVYTDKECTKQFETRPFTYLGQSKYSFSSKTIKSLKIDVLYAQLKSQDEVVSFSTLYSTEQTGTSAQLHPFEYLFRSISEKQLLYFKFKSYYNPVHPQPTSFVIHSFEVDSQVIPLVFRVCNSTLLDCTSISKYTNFTTVISNVTKSNFQNSKQLIYEILLDSNTYNTLTKDNKYGIIVIEVAPPPTKTDSFVAMFFNDKNMIEMLYPQKYIKSTIAQGHTKYYILHNTNAEYNSLIVNLGTLHGKATIEAFRSDPRRNTTIGVTATQGTLILYDKLTQPFYFQVKGVSQASYILVSVLFLNKVKQQDVKVDVIELQLRKQYTFILKPAQNQIIKITSDQPQIYFNFRAKSKIGFCLLDSPSSQCSENIFSFEKDLSQPLNTTNGTIYIRLLNINTDRSVEVTTHYVLKQDAQSPKSDTCIRKEVGKVITEIINNRACMIFQLTESKDIRGIFLRTQMAYMIFTVEICGNNIPVQSSVFIINKLKLDSYCDSKTSIRQMKVHMKSDLSQKESMKVQYVVQYLNDILFLPSAIAFQENVIAAQGQLRRYHFRVLDKVRTQVKINIKIGSVNAFLTMVNETDIKKAIVTDKQFDLKTQNTKFFTDSTTIDVTQKYLNSKQCFKCVLVIAVYNAADTVGTLVQYSIEVVTGNSQELVENQQKHSFLPKGSFSYFQYDCKQVDGSVLFDVQDNNRKCAKIYLGENQFPDEKNSDTVLVGNSLGVNCKTRKTHYLSIESLEDCPVSVSAQSTPFKLFKLTSGVPITSNFSAGEIVYFTFIHYSQKAFKVFTLEKSGLSTIYINQLTTDIVNSLRKNQSKIEEFTIKSHQTNQIEVTPSANGFCKFCPYIIAVKAETKLDEASVLLVSKKQFIPMIPDRIIYDQLEPGQSTQLKYYDTMKGYINVNALKSHLLVNINLGMTNIEKHIYGDNRIVEKLQYNFITANKDLNWNPISVKITNMGNQLGTYSLYLTKDNSPQANAQIIKQGVATYLSQRNCVRGYFTNQQSVIDISADQSEGDKLQNLTLQLVVNNATVDFNKMIVRNTIQVKYHKNNFDNQPYLLCITNLQQTLKQQLTLLQTSTLNLLPVSTWTTISKSSSYLIHHNGQLMLDMFTCSGQVSYKHSLTYEQLNQQNTSLIRLDTILNLDVTPQLQKNHVVYINSLYGVSFIKIDSPSAIVKWEIVDRQKQIGTGYANYKSGELSWTQNETSVTIQWNSLQKIQKTKTNILQTNYKLFISTSLSEAKSWAYCEIVSQKNLQAQQLLLKGNDQSTPRLFTFSKQNITQYFKESIQNNEGFYYFTLIADASIQVPVQVDKVINNITEYYRFMYFPLKLPATIFSGNKSPKIFFFVAILAVVIVATIAIIYIILRKIVPIINKLRGGDIQLEQQKAQPKKQQNKQKSGPTQTQIAREQNQV